MLVMGSMIGSGIFIVSAEIGREVGSPALLIGAWVVTGLMTIVAALSYGELAAMMPRAGGQYVYLREALGPLWGFLYGWTLFLVIQTGTIAAVGVAFGKFLGVFFPSISSTQLDPAFVEGSADSCRPHGAGQHGRWHQYAESDGDSAGDHPVVRQRSWDEDGRGDSERLHHGESAWPCSGSQCLGFAFCRNPEAILANFSGTLLAQRGAWGRCMISAEECSSALLRFWRWRRSALSSRLTRGTT